MITASVSFSSASVSFSSASVTISYFQLILFFLVYKFIAFLNKKKSFGKTRELKCRFLTEQTKLMFRQIATVLPLRTAWIADILSQAPLSDVQRQCCWNRGSGDEQRLQDYGTTERPFNAVSALCVAVERRGSPLT